MHEKQALMQEDLIEAQPAPPRRTGRRLTVALVLLLLIAGGVLAAAWRYPAVQRDLAALFGRPTAPERLVQSRSAAPPQAAPAASASLPAPGQPASAATFPPAQILAGSTDARMALLEERLARLAIQAEAASGNAARTEGLLIAYAARRTLDRGAPLGYLEDQLRLRFADSQPNAVATLIETANAPVTLDTLHAQLEALAPDLTGSAPQSDGWSWMRSELSALFVIRHQSAASSRPEERLARAKLMLAAGKTGEAVAQIESLPGARAALPWIAAARRYDAVQRALDLIETAAMLDPYRLKDSKGGAVEQPSPLAGPT